MRLISALGGRGYATVYLGLSFASCLAGIALFEQPAAFMQILKWWGDLFIWVVPIVVGLKEAGKFSKRFGSNGESKPK